ncbi:MAG: formimidoylglutamase [Rubricoccaceae bacterium]|nr:formimidoylglutamase [Rubricoccaceae bacterium]
MSLFNTFNPAGLDAPETAADDPRVGRWLAAQQALDDGTRVALVGFPSDEGVRRNGGRPGAAEGPRALRERLYALTPDAEAPERFEALLGHTVDLGDVPVTGDLERDQERLGEAVGALLTRGVVPVVLGGGHETAYGHFLGHVLAGRDVSILNWDAHADVRPLRDGQAHSGSPFRQALEHGSGRCRGYTVAGLLPWRVAAAHRRFIEGHGGEAVPLGALTPERIADLAAQAAGPAMATFDLDAVDAAQAPGVSAPGIGGMDAGRWLLAAEACGRSPAFASFDVVELNPRVDVDGRTATLAALTVWHLLRGLAARFAAAV